MKRFAFAAAAALLGTGCISSSTTTTIPPQEVGSVNLYWSFEKYAPAQTSGVIDYDTTFAGTANGPCAQSAVETVTVDSPVGQQTVDCVHTNGVQGLGIDGIPAGTQPFRFRGNRSGTVVYDTTVNLQVVPGTNANTASSYYVVVKGAYAPFDAFAYLSYAPNAFYQTCASASYPAVDYDVSDVLGNLVLTGSVACQDPAAGFPVISVPDLDLDNYTIRMTGWTGNPAVRTFDSCTSSTLKLLAFDHFASQTGAGGLAVTLDTPPACSL
ncbi:MAG TPA: hypothetical protein VF841_10580 [Anaeromyxobacter sp.]